jgi:hypothetical protein
MGGFGVRNPAPPFSLKGIPVEIPFFSTRHTDPRDCSSGLPTQKLIEIDAGRNDRVQVAPADFAVASEGSVHRPFSDRKPFSL